ncbi:MAG TPA: hypothetical protein PKO16_00190 [Bacteroidia bacterium]|jgi:hypothetical protein|nr:hypothetical protein [Bacteroidia bacterium]
MKTSQLLLSVLVAMTTVCVSATNVNKAENRGVTAQQITSYLNTCSHQHSVFSVNMGTNVAVASIENCRTSTIYIYGGIVIGHTDSGVACY